ncbi:hypothetical protein VIBC2010_10976 [Vibrio caribbeanicus ATCC BAA-2122]|uniref:Uncharacterized protein n=1 Tax=Vibrio caribbeanicus ATCC BAA-2122 TaxID=796620 RepID=E3BMY1_9VIBR|nr:hypothetical protein VIBC2010_10976 [Vibrio caribbeanicus ATCC BAA-2122]
MRYWGVICCEDESIKSWLRKAISCDIYLLIVRNLDYQFVLFYSENNLFYFSHQHSKEILLLWLPDMNCVFKQDSSTPSLLYYEHPYLEKTSNNKSLEKET